MCRQKIRRHWREDAVRSVACRLLTGANDFLGLEHGGGRRGGLCSSVKKMKKEEEEEEEEEEEVEKHQS